MTAWRSGCERGGLDQGEFEDRLRAKERFYHIHHPFHVLMNAGKLEREAIQGWVANRFYYQVSIPVKDAAVLANCPDRAVRREWIKRIIDHDGSDGDEGADLERQFPGVALAADVERFLETAHGTGWVRW